MTRARRLVLALALASAAAPSAAIDRIRIAADTVTAGDISLQQVSGALELRSAQRTRLDLAARSVGLPPEIGAQTGAVSALRVRCDDPVIHEPRFACPRLQSSARAAKLPPLRFDGRVDFASNTGAFDARGSGPQLAGAPLDINVALRGEDLTLALRLPAVEIEALRPALAPWIALPAELSISGRTSLSVDLVQRHRQSSMTVAADIMELGFQNGAATWISEKLGGHFVATVDLAASPQSFQVTFASRTGQFLGGPVLLDLARNPLQLEARGTFGAGTLQVAQFALEQSALASASGSAEVRLEPLSILAARIELEELRFPDAYTSYAQLLLATTPFNQLQTSGTARGAVTIASDQPVALDLTVTGFAMRDPARELDVTGVDSELHWTAGATGPPRPSYLSWESARGWGVTGARSRVDFATQDRSFQLLAPARLPLFDGAVVINRLAVENFGREEMSGVFDAFIEPISLSPVARTLGWPEFSGQLSGRIPGLTYRDKVLTLEGNLEADVFDGRVVASNLRVREPLGQWPRLYADIVARNLDLDLVTRTFEFGSITGRLDVDLTGLETFNWSPTAFDLVMRTPPGDRSRRRISQKAVQNLSNLGGGGGGVAAALQTGALRFFDTFRYDRIGLSCRLRDDVCQMAGAGRADGGYYIVKGSGLPRIDIIGISNRVDWPRLVSQVVSAINSSDDIVVN